MPTCAVCGEEDFQCESGLYFCTTCSTQSQQFVEEEHDVFADTIGVMGPQRSIRQRIKDTSQKDKTSEDDAGRPWMLVEGFTVLLREQVKSLIKLGADPRLKDVVLRLWSLYMGKSGLGFHPPDTDDTGSPDPSRPPAKRRSTLAHSRARDKFITLGTDKKMSRIRSLLEFKKLGKGKISGNKQDHQAMVAAFGGEEFYDEDNPLAMPEHELGVKDMILDCEREEQEGLQDTESISYKKLWARHYKDIGVMSVLNTLSLCYLGLQYVGAVVMPLDLIRWVGNGCVPYTNAPQIFPEDMKMNELDWNIFCRAAIPDVPGLREKTTSLAIYLDVLPLPIMDVKLVIARFILELNLPGDLYAFVSDIFDRCPPSLDSKKIHVKIVLPDYASIAMCYIIIGLKLLYKLDNRREMQLSEMTKKLSKLLVKESELDLFDWMSWLNYQAGLLFKHCPISSDWKEMQRLTDTSELLKRYKSYVQTRQKFGSNKSMNSSVGNISHVFGKLEEKVLPNQPTEGLTGSDEAFEFMEIDELLMDDDAQAAARGRTQSSQPHSSKKCDKQDFTTQTLLHIIDWEEFLDHVQTGGLSDQTLRDSCTEIHQQSDSMEDDDECDHMSERSSGINSAIHAIARHALKKRTQTGNKNILQDLTAVCDEFSGNEPPDYVFYTYNKMESIPVEHKAYKWLLQMANRITGVSSEILHNYVQRTELALLKDPSSLDRNTKLTRKRFIKKYFTSNLHK